MAKATATVDVPVTHEQQSNGHIRPISEPGPDWAALAREAAARPRELDALREARLKAVYRRLDELVPILTRLSVLAALEGRPAELTRLEQEHIALRDRRDDLESATVTRRLAAAEAIALLGEAERERMAVVLGRRTRAGLEVAHADRHIAMGHAVGPGPQVAATMKATADRARERMPALLEAMEKAGHVQVRALVAAAETGSERGGLELVNAMSEAHVPGGAGLRALLGRDGVRIATLLDISRYPDVE